MPSGHDTGNHHVGKVEVKKIQLQIILNNMYEEGYAFGTMVLIQITIHAGIKSFP